MKVFKLGFIVAATFSLAACGNTTVQDSDSSAAKSSTLVEQQAKETLSVVMSLEQDGKEVEGATQELEVEEGTTVLEALKGQYEVIEEDGLILSIDGMEQDEDAGNYWLYEVNGEQPTVGAAECEIKDGDQVKWLLNALQ
ncbi:DUF4430 domain-containing protein [Carnobacterium inhibens]|uniref:Peptidase n=1 Tax=Carnobacterium inhibens subsp. gilichinskyi TaxID=1266845 RepID=U5SA48_9LACT|nr:DUF4430 domain-containing protein [Carnobacterium inhibens]AGY82144.1 peptidase [Carnobacterium inhibens subsp. gilichinskyi]